jgi:hypothetical protein
VVSTLPARHQPVAVARFPRRRWRQRLPGLALLASGAGMVPWLTYLAITLPARTSVPHWSAAWVGLDVMEALGLAVTGWLVRRGDPRRCLAAAATAMLLVVDAWFDISTAGSGLTGAVAMAACAELPMAAVCSVVACRAVRDGGRPPHPDSPEAELDRQQGAPSLAVGGRVSTEGEGLPVTRRRSAPGSAVLVGPGAGHLPGIASAPEVRRDAG